MIYQAIMTIVRQVSNLNCCDSMVDIVWNTYPILALLFANWLRNSLVEKHLILTVSLFHVECVLFITMCSLCGHHMFGLRVQVWEYTLVKKNWNWVLMFIMLVARTLYICFFDDRYLLFEDKQSSKLGGADKCRIYVIFHIRIVTYLFLTCDLFLKLSLICISCKYLHFSSILS